MDINEQLTAAERLIEAFRQAFEYGFERMQDDLTEEDDSLFLMVEQKAKSLRASWGLTDFPEVHELLVNGISDAFSSRAALNEMLSVVEV